MTFLINSRESANRRSGKQRIVAFIFICLISVFAAIQWLAPHLLPALFTSLARPFWRAEFSIESGSLKSSQKLLAENEALRLRLAEMETRLNTINAVESENDQLKLLLGIDDDIGQSGVEPQVTSSNPRFTLAPVLARPPFASYDELIIDGGVDRDFAVGDRVYASGNILIGSITDALKRTSKVILFSSPDQTHQVLIGKSNAEATAVGRGAGQYLSQVSREVRVAEGDFVINPSLDDKPFGVVEAVLNEPAEPFQTILFAPPVNLYQLRWVLVEKSAP